MAAFCLYSCQSVRVSTFLHGMPAGQAVSRFGSAIFLHGMPAGQAVSRFGSGIFLHGMPAGQAVSRFGSAIFFFFYTGCPQGRPCQTLPSPRRDVLFSLCSTKAAQ